MKLRIGIVLASALAVASGACASAGSVGNGATLPGGEALAQGERPRQNQQTQAAERELGLAMLAATDEEARTRYAAALASAEQAIAQDPTNPLPWLQAGNAYVGLGEYLKADSALTRAEDLRPVYRLETSGIREQAWIDLYQEAIPFVNEGQYDQAVPFYEAANAIYDERPEIRMVLGQIYLSQGETDRAIVNLRRALEITSADHPEMDSATVASWREQADELPPMIADAYIQAQRYEEAVSTLRPLLEADPTNQAYARSLASIYIQIDQPDSARAVYQRIAAAGGLDARANYEMGIGYYQMRDWTGAAEAFEAAARMAPSDRDAIEWWARAIQIDIAEKEDAGVTPEPGEVQQLVRAAERWVSLDPNSQTAYIILAQALNKAGDEARTLEVIETIEALPFTMEDLQIQKARTGGASVFGEVRNKSLEAGHTVTLRFTFFGPGGSTLGTQEARVSLPAPDASQVFNVQFNSSQPVEGYSYTVVM